MAESNDAKSPWRMWTENRPLYLVGDGQSRQFLVKLMKLGWQPARVGLTENVRSGFADSKSGQLFLLVFIYRKVEK